MSCKAVMLPDRDPRSPAPEGGRPPELGTTSRTPGPGRRRPRFLLAGYTHPPAGGRISAPAPGRAWCSRATAEQSPAALSNRTGSCVGRSSIVLHQNRAKTLQKGRDSRRVLPCSLGQEIHQHFTRSRRFQEVPGHHELVGTFSFKRKSSSEGQHAGSALSTVL